MKKTKLLISDSSTLTKSANALRLRSHAISEEMKNGNFTSMFKGQGIEFSGVREYLLGDDVRAIDWNVTARTGKTFVKQYDEEREQTVFLVVDRSLSMETGSENFTRLNVDSETAALLLLASQNNACPVGAVLFDGNITFSSSPRRNNEHTMLILTKLAKRDEKVSRGSCLSNAIKGAEQLLKNRSMVFVISDFRCEDYEKSLASIAQKHDVVAIQITDNNDSEVPNMGLLSAVDAESGMHQYIPTNSADFRHFWRGNQKKNLEQWKYMCKRHGIVPLIISTTDDPAVRLSKFFAVWGRE